MLAVDPNPNLYSSLGGAGVLVYLDFMYHRGCFLRFCRGSSYIGEQLVLTLPGLCVRCFVIGLRQMVAQAPVRVENAENDEEVARMHLAGDLVILFALV